MREYCSEAQNLRAWNGSPSILRLGSLQNNYIALFSCLEKQKLYILGSYKHLLPNPEILWTPGSYSTTWCLVVFKGGQLPRKPGISLQRTCFRGKNYLPFLQKEDLCSNVEMRPTFDLDKECLPHSYPTQWSTSLLFSEFKPVRSELSEKESHVME